MASHEQYAGGCRCGAIRFLVAGPPVMVEYCHCESCRRSSGSVVSVLAGFPRSGFEVLSGCPLHYQSIPGVKRSFCGTCGSPLFYENRDYPDEIYISVGAFDQPEKLPPDRHVWACERVSWYHPDDGLSQYPKFSAAGAGGVAPPYRPPEES